MTFRLPRSDRLALLGCTAVAVALACAGCGSGDDATAESTRTSPARPAAKARMKGAACPRQVTRFVEALDETLSQLAVGLSYDQYAAKVGDLRVAYREIPVERLTIDCLSRRGTPGERALNKYIDALNAWGECLADAACSTASIEPVLQREWRIASHFLTEAQ